MKFLVLRPKVFRLFLAQGSLFFEFGEHMVPRSAACQGSISSALLSLQLQRCKLLRGCGFSFYWSVFLFTTEHTNCPYDPLHLHILCNSSALLPTPLCVKHSLYELVFTMLIFDFFLCNNNGLNYMHAPRRYQFYNDTTELRNRCN